MDMELDELQRIASLFSGVKLSRDKPKQPCAELPQHKPRQQNDDSMLLLGLMLILAADGADKMLLLMLLYIFQKS